MLQEFQVLVTAACAAINYNSKCISKFFLLILTEFSFIISSWEKMSPGKTRNYEFHQDDNVAYEKI